MLNTCAAGVVVWWCWCDGWMDGCGLQVEGLTALCRERPLKLDAVKWLGQWLLTHNPNQPSIQLAAEPASASSASASASSAAATTIKSSGAGAGAGAGAGVVVSAAEDEKAEGGGGAAPAPAAPRRMLWVVGGPGVGKRTLCARFAVEYGYEHINVGAMLRANCKPGCDYSDLISDCLLNGRVVPSRVVLQLLSGAMRAAPPHAHARNRWLISDFPGSLDQALEAEALWGAPNAVLYLSVASEHTMTERIAARVAAATAAAAKPGAAAAAAKAGAGAGEAVRAEDRSADSVRKRIALFREEVLGAVVAQWRRFPGKLRELSVDPPASVDQLYATLTSAVAPLWGDSKPTQPASAAVSPIDIELGLAPVPPLRLPVVAATPKSPKKGKKAVAPAATPTAAPEFLKIKG
jgi:UMP-CMP kinase